MNIIEVRQFPPIEDSLVFCFTNIHNRRQALIIVRRNQTIKVAKLNNRTNLLVFRDSLTAERLLLIRHILWLDFHSKTSAHSYINTILQRSSAEYGMVWHSRDMTCHGDGWEEIAGSILHINTLHGIRIITYPKLIKTTEHTPIGTATATCATLNHHILILSTNTVDNLRKSLMISDVEMALIGCRQVLAAMIHNGHIGIPLNVGYIWIFSK